MEGTLPGFLTSFGLNLATQSPRGNIFATAAEAAKDPFDTFQQAKFAEAKEEREFEREKELQMLKNLDEDDRIQIQKEAQVVCIVVRLLWPLFYSILFLQINQDLA